MANWIKYLIVGIAVIIIFVFSSTLKKNYIKNMSKILYVDNNPDLYLKKLDNIEGKLFINKKTRLFRKIDALVMKQDKDSVINTFKELESKKLSFGQKVSLYEKEVSYYIQNQMYDEAIKANENVQKLSTMVEIEDLKSLAKDCQALIEIYINKNGSLATVMVENGDKSNIESIKGTYYFRAAKCYYYRKDNRMIEKYLDKALKYLNNTSMKTIINECKKDYTNLEKY